MTEKSFREMGKDAQAKGLKKFFTGVPCQKGHICERYSHRGYCVECVKEKSSARHKEISAKPPSVKKCKTCGNIWIGCSHKCGKCRAAQRKNNIEECLKKEASTREANRDRFNKASRKAYRKNKFYYLNYSAVRRINKQNATLKMSEHQFSQLKEFWKNCPHGHHVDHIIPIKSDLVCGLHAIANLQYLPAIENIRKRNNWPTCRRSMQPAWFDVVEWCMSAE